MSYHIRLTTKLSEHIKQVAEEKGVSPHRLVSSWIVHHFGTNPFTLSQGLKSWLVEVASELKISIPQLIVRAVNFYVMAKKDIRRYEEQGDFPKTTGFQETKSQETKPQDHDPWA
jgi:hypothetical protein